MITLHTLTPSSRRTNPKRVGRGNSSGKGTTAGRGTKGQRARTGGRNKTGRRALKALIERTPKIRGFRSIHEPWTAVPLDAIARAFTGTEVITPAKLAAKGLIRRARPGVKIVGATTSGKKLTIKAQKFSAGAKASIEKAGGHAIELTS